MRHTPVRVWRQECACAPSAVLRVVSAIERKISVLKLIKNCAAHGHAACLHWRCSVSRRAAMAAGARGTEKGKPIERWGRKATGLRESFPQIAGLPGGSLCSSKPAPRHFFGRVFSLYVSSHPRIASSRGTCFALLWGKSVSTPTRATATTGERRYEIFKEQDRLEFVLPCFPSGVYHGTRV